MDESAESAAVAHRGKQLADGCRYLTRKWHSGKLVAEDFPLEQISDAVQQDDTLAWADVVGADPVVLQTLADELHLSPHAVEDAISRYERPKLDRYPTHMFLNAYALATESGTGALRMCKVSAFITKQALITVRGSDWFDLTVVADRWEEAPELLDFGVAGLLYGLLDVIVDSHFEVVQLLDDQIEDIEDSLFDDRPRTKEAQKQTYLTRKSLVRMRRLVLPMREVVNTLMRRDIHVIDPGLAPYYQDLYDHVLRVIEWTESLQEMISTAFETNLSLQDSRLNQVMKRLTSWAAIIAVPTAVTGYFGQNVPYPGFGHHWGFWLSTGVIVGIVVVLYSGFKKREWL